MINNANGESAVSPNERSSEFHNKSKFNLGGCFFFGIFASPLMFYLFGPLPSGRVVVVVDPFIHS